MPARELIVLGTASQVPTRTRSHNSMFLRWDSLGILFDPGEGTQRQLLLAGVAATQITHIAITHFHGDHCLGLAAMLQRISLDQVPHPVEVFFPASGQEFFERLRYAAIYNERATIVPRPITRPIGDTDESPPFLLADLGEARLYARPLNHRCECFGYRLEEPDGRRMLPERLAAAGIVGPQVRELIERGSLVHDHDGRTVRLEDVSEPRPGQVFALVMDTRVCAGGLTLAKGADLLVSESTFLSSEAEEAAAYAHLTASQAATMARDAGARKLVLTHFSQRYPTTEGFVAEAGAIFPAVVAAADFTRVAVPPRT